MTSGLSLFAEPKCGCGCAYRYFTEKILSTFLQQHVEYRLPDTQVILRVVWKGNIVRSAREDIFQSSIIIYGILYTCFPVA